MTARSMVNSLFMNDARHTEAIAALLAAAERAAPEAAAHLRAAAATLAAQTTEELDAELARVAKWNRDRKDAIARAMWNAPDILRAC